MAYLSSRESSKPQSPQKAFLMGELTTVRRSLAQKDEEMSGQGDGSIEELQEVSLNMVAMRKKKIGD